MQPCTLTTPPAAPLADPDVKHINFVRGAVEPFQRPTQLLPRP